MRGKKSLSFNLAKGDGRWLLSPNALREREMNKKLRDKIEDISHLSRREMVAAMTDLVGELVDELGSCNEEILTAHVFLTSLDVGKLHWSLSGRIDALLYMLHRNPDKLSSLISDRLLDGLTERMEN